MVTKSPFTFPRICVNSWGLPLPVAKNTSDRDPSAVMRKCFTASHQRTEQSVVMKSCILLQNFEFWKCIMSKRQKITNHLLISALPFGRDISYRDGRVINKSPAAANAAGKGATCLRMDILDVT